MTENALITNADMVFDDTHQLGIQGDIAVQTELTVQDLMLSHVG